VYVKEKFVSFSKAEKQGYINRESCLPPAVLTLHHFGHLEIPAKSDVTYSDGYP
jgi:hypothetical protein